MSQSTPLHPDKDLLVAFGLGQLEPDEATTVESHLEECDRCCETLLDLKDDTFVALVRQAREPASIPDAGSERPATERTEGRVDKDSCEATIVLLRDGQLERRICRSNWRSIRGIASLN